MDKHKHHYLIPMQERGAEKDLVHSIVAMDTDDALDLFIDAKERLLNINNWKQYSTVISAEFALMDSHGKPAKRNARTGDYIRIDIPGPGTTAGNGYDWVHIEAVEYDDYPDLDLETFAMRVRPCANPQGSSEDIAHFFGKDATSTFVIERRGSHLFATYHGRNEVANHNAGIVDNVRNTAVAIGAWLGMSDAQWKSLITGFIEVGE